ncbi:DUF2817 domain-containing protein [Paraburkholderia sp. 40]|uniref:DUF2817 domain-containing protein n=1 Tax=Paraburkholderia sp. 40 TaxID=2991059 RepID=UPI003D191561
MNPPSYFASSYGEARRLCLRSAAAAAARVESHVIAGLGGLGNEELATDVARIGPASARRLRVLTSVAANVAGPVLDTLLRTCTHARTTAIAIE